MIKTQHFDKNSPEIKYLCTKDKHLAKVIQMLGPLDYQLVDDDFAFLTSQIIGQMLSNKVADVLTDRLRTTCGGTISVKNISKLTDQQIRAVGMSASKVKYLRNLVSAINHGTVDFKQYETMTDQKVIQSLTSVKGIGKWSAKMYLIFSLDRRDILPFEDVAFLQGYGWVYKTDDYSPKMVQKKCHKWHPYTSIAARYMYKALDSGLTKEPFHLFK